eukprot:CAMPEP_0185266254 /NCGR_PEP_ID=MMETSP1359-20130426/30486_1 /TAXON_ID=552665 /ORGANISM="Bigelowiella longifila, Strain CCMP242" /LENGTH=42 /DNA_ID= /DNA_START= /DNA_END= /DNA_ORIENTATION=
MSRWRLKWERPEKKHEGYYANKDFKEWEKKEVVAWLEDEKEP